MARTRQQLIRGGIVAAVLVPAMPASLQAASGRIDLSWGTCSPLVQDVTATSGPVSLIASVIGNDDTHHTYEVAFLVADASRNVPDAWQFNDSGCQGAARLEMNHLPPAALASSCPAFGPDGPGVQQVKGYTFLTPTNWLYPTTEIQGFVASYYPSGMTSNPAQRYFLAEFRFDHALSVSGPGTPGVTCGGLETPLCFALLTGPYWQRPGVETSRYYSLTLGDEVWFEPGANVFVTVNGATGCPHVPAAATTWGQIKSVYRR